MNTGIMDYYALLNVARNATADEIKRAFRALAVQFHPDKNPGDGAAEDKFKEINRAYEVLGDPDKRMLYDRSGRAMFESFYGNGNMQGGAGCGAGRGCGCGRRRGGMWRNIMQNMAIHDICVSSQEAAGGVVISIKPEDAPDESAFEVMLPGNLKNGDIIRCVSDAGSDNIFIRIVVTDER